MRNDLRSLEDKLRLLAEGEDIGLTSAEAAVYGVDYADVMPEEDIQEEQDDE